MIVANDQVEDYEIENLMPLTQEENNEQLLNEDRIENNDVNDDVVVDNQEGLDVVIEDNIVSEEDDIVDPNDEEDEESNVNQQDENDNDNIEDVAVVANIDDEAEPVNEYMNNRPRKTCAGAGVERMQVNYDRKGHAYQRQFNLIHNGKLNTKGNEDSDVTHVLMQVACNVMFTQMNSRPELKKCAQMPIKQGVKIFGQAAVAAMTKEFS